MEYKTGSVKVRRLEREKKKPMTWTGSEEVALLDSCIYLLEIICFLKYFCLFSYEVVWNSL